MTHLEKSLKREITIKKQSYVLTIDPAGNLWVPDADYFMEVELIPVLGSGKIDLVAVAKIAKERFGGRN